MQIEIGAPACMPLALAAYAGGQAALLGVSLRYPPINLTARPAPHLEVTGARADHVAAAVRQYLQSLHLSSQAEVEIELAIPSQMGLGSDALLALAGAQAAAWVHSRAHADVPALAIDVGLGTEYALEIHAYARGGVLLVESPATANGVPALMRRQVVRHADDAAWAFVLYLPRVPAGTAASLEADWLAAWLRARAYLSSETGRIMETELWPALDRDDLAGFGRALLALQALNVRALEQAGEYVPLTGGEQVILDLAREHGAVAWGRSPTGLALYALIRGAAPSVALRKQIVARVGIHAGTALAAIVDNDGARYGVQSAPPIYTGASPLVSRSQSGG